MLRFILYSLSFAAYVCADRMTDNQGHNNGVSYDSCAKSAMYAADAALSYWRKNK